VKNLAVSEIVKAVSGVGSINGDVTVSDICTDTRTIKEGSLFVCIEGENFDGHQFAKAALENGARALLCHKDTGCENQILVRDTRKALLDLAGYYRRLFDIPVAGVTGSVGKTTVKEMTHAVFSKKLNTLKTQGNLNNEIGLPLTLFRIDENTQAAVVEMGMSALGEISRMSQAAAPTMGIISNIGVSHLEKLGSQENILRAKLELADGMADEAPLILNGDDRLLYTAKIQGRPIYYYGIENKFCRFKAYDIESDETGSRFTLDFGYGEQRVNLPAIGIHNIYNALAAFSAGFLLGVEPEAAAAALHSYEPEGMRQNVRQVAGITFVEDCYNASPDSMRAALSALKALKANRRIAVLGDMKELGSASAEGHRQTGAFAAQSGADAVLTIGIESQETARAAREGGVRSVESFDDKSALAKRLAEIMEPGDAVLFKASRGMKLEEVINEIYRELEK